MWTSITTGDASPVSKQKLSFISCVHTRSHHIGRLPRLRRRHLDSCQPRFQQTGGAQLFFSFFAADDAVVTEAIVITHRFGTLRLILTPPAPCGGATAAARKTYDAFALQPAANFLKGL